MSVRGGPDIVQEGLVLCLDAANIKSYPRSGTSWRDLTINGNNGTLTNGPTFDSSNGGNIVFDGVNDYVPVNIQNIGTFNSTVMFVVKLPIYSGVQRCILSYRTDINNLYIGKRNQGIFCYYGGLSPSPNFDAGNITDNSICFVTVTLDSTNTAISTYVNGVLAGTATRTGWPSSNNTVLNLGYDAGGTNEYMLGNMYMFAHYNRVLSAQEILQNFNVLRSRFGI